MFTEITSRSEMSSIVSLLSAKINVSTESTISGVFTIVNLIGLSAS